MFLQVKVLTDHLRNRPRPGGQENRGQGIVFVNMRLLAVTLTKSLQRMRHLEGVVTPATLCSAGEGSVVSMSAGEQVRGLWCPCRLGSRRGLGGDRDRDCCCRCLSRVQIDTQTPHVADGSLVFPSAHLGVYQRDICPPATSILPPPEPYAVTAVRLPVAEESGPALSRRRS